MQLFYILVAIVMFGILVAIHEFGHFAVAKLCGVRVLEFAIGWGPLLWRKEGEETKYSIRLLPLGGYCMLDDGQEGTADERTFKNQGFFKQLAILIAGVVMNMVLGFLLMVGLYSSATGFYTAELQGLAPEVSSAVTLEAGDVLYRIDGERVYAYSDVSTLLAMGDGNGYDLVVFRDGAKVSLDDVPLTYQTYTSQSGEAYTGYGLFFGTIEEATPLTVIKHAWYATLNFARTVRLSLGMLTSGEAGLEDMSGPVGIVDTISQVGMASPSILVALESIAYFAALLSVNLAVMNLLPIPGLDGGRIVFLAIDAVSMMLFRKKIPEKYMNAITNGCFMALLGLILLITFKDIWVIIKGFLPF